MYGDRCDLLVRFAAANAGGLLSRPGAAREDVGRQPAKLKASLHRV